MGSSATSLGRDWRHAGRGSSGVKLGRYGILLLSLAGSALAGVGCTNANQPFNAVSTPLEGRVQNRTRAAMGVDMLPLAMAGARRAAATPRLAGDAPPGSRPTSLPQGVPGAIDAQRDDCFVGIAISGGGSRSANFSAACLFQLQRLRLLQHVDYISSVSGGSLTAAYYCLSPSGSGDEQWNPQAAQHLLTHPFANDVIVQFLLPWNGAALALSDWDRSDLLAASFRDHLFSRNGRTLTFADLRPDRPHLLINATDLQSGRRFVFSNESFDELNSDLGKYPLAYAVAASAAVPVIMHQVTLRDYSTVFREYRHLIDGGIADNLGVQTLVQTYEGQTQAAEQAGRPLPYRRGAVLVVIDARTRFDARLSERGDTGLIESLKYGAGLTSTALLNRASSATLADIIVQHSPGSISAATLRQQIQTLERTGYLELRDQYGRPVRVVHLALSRVGELTRLPHFSFSENVNNIATYFSIDPAEAYNLYQAADMLVRERFEPRLRAIADDLSMPPATLPPPR